MKHFTEEKYRFWETVIKAISALLTVAIIAIALFAYIYNRQANENHQRIGLYLFFKTITATEFYPTVAMSVYTIYFILSF
jgi:hypothetical protein